MSHHYILYLEVREPQDLAEEIRRTQVGVDREIAPALGRDGSQGVGLWWYRAGRARDRHLPFDDPARAARTGSGRNARANPDTPARWRPEASRCKGSALAGGP